MMVVESFNPPVKVTTKRKDPNYSPVSAHIPKSVAKRLRMYCAEYETTIAETMEKAIDTYLDNIGYPKQTND